MIPRTEATGVLYDYKLSCSEEMISRFFYFKFGERLNFFALGGYKENGSLN